MRKSDLPFIHKGVAETNWQDIPAVLKKFANRAECDKRIIEEFNSLLKTKRYKFKVFVAVQKNTPVGFISIGELIDHVLKSPCGALLDFWIAPESRKQGIGDKLFDYALKKLQDHDYTHLGLMVSASNKASLHMCECRGFSPTYINMDKLMSSKRK